MREILPILISVVLILLAYSQMQQRKKIDKIEKQVSDHSHMYKEMEKQFNHYVKVREKIHTTVPDFRKTKLMDVPTLKEQLELSKQEERNGNNG